MFLSVLCLTLSAGSDAHDDTVHVLGNYGHASIDHLRWNNPFVALIRLCSNFDAMEIEVNAPKVT